MIKIVVNTPKGGVGKTTTATNIAMLLARAGFRVMVIDLAGGLLMSQALSQKEEFNANSGNIIIRNEGQRIPTTFVGARNYDYAVLDTDDSFTVPEDLLLGMQSGWKVISPVNPSDYMGMIRIPREIRAVALASLLSSRNLNISIVTNLAYGGNAMENYESLQEKLQENSIGSLLTPIILPHATSNEAPLLLNNAEYSSALANLLRELGVEL